MEALCIQLHGRRNKQISVQLIKIYLQNLVRSSFVKERQKFTQKNVLKLIQIYTVAEQDIQHQVQKELVQLHMAHLEQMEH